MQRGDKSTKCSQPGIHLQPGGDPRDQEAQGGVGENSSDRILPHLASPKQSGVELRRADQSEGLNHTHDFSH